MKLVKKVHRTLLLLSKNPVVKKEIDDRLREITKLDKLYVVKSEIKHKWCICSENLESKKIDKKYVRLFPDVKRNHNSHAMVLSYDKYISASDVTCIYELSDIIMDDCVVNIEDIDKRYLKSVTNRMNSKDKDYLMYYNYKKKRL